VRFRVANGDWLRQNIRDDCRTTADDPGADAERFCGAIRMKESTLSLDVPHVPSSHSTYTMENLFDVAAQYALPATVATVGAMYLDAKYHIAKDLNDWRSKRKFSGVIAEGAKAMGDYYTLYHALELNNQKQDAFWFEGRSWTFADVRREADKLAQWFINQGIHTKGLLSMLRCSDFRFCCCLHDQFSRGIFHCHGTLEIGCYKRND